MVMAPPARTSEAKAKVQVSHREGRVGKAGKRAVRKRVRVQSAPVTGSWRSARKILGTTLLELSSLQQHNVTVRAAVSRLNYTAMNSQNGCTSQQSAAIAFMLLVVSALIPVVLLWYTQETTQQDEERVVGDQQLEAAAERIARIALRMIRISRERSEGCGDNEEQEQPRNKKARVSSYSYERARLAIESNYFSPTPLFDDRQFERMFRVTKSIVELLIQICGKADPFFTNVQDVTGRYNISPVAKVLVAIKQLAYGCSPSAFIDYFQMSETSARRSMIKFARIVSTDDELQSVYGRQMTRSDARRLSALHEACHGVAGMVGSLDCMHVGWKNCPVAWQGSNTGKSGKPTIVLEAMADHNLWFWHHSFGWPGSLNDINIWNRSCLLKAFLDGSFARDVDFEFTIGDDKVFNRLWVLVDGIYPDLSRFVKTLQEPVGRRACRYAVWQESARKDIELEPLESFNVNFMCSLEKLSCGM